MNETEYFTYLITNGEITSQNFPEKSKEILKLLEVAVEAKVSMIQIREKQLPAKLVFELALQAVKISQNSNTKILVNDRADIALAAKADGVHLTSNSISAKIIRQNFPKDFIIGVSAHTIAEVAQAKSDEANFATFSPIFQTASKERYGAPQGIEKLSEVVKSVKDFKIIALGGIDETNFAASFLVGANGIAGIRLFNQVGRLSEVVKKIAEFARENE